MGTSASTPLPDHSPPAANPDGPAVGALPSPETRSRRSTHRLRPWNSTAPLAAWFVLTAAVAVAVPPSRAAADNTVTVLGIRSVEGDDDFARSLTGVLRHAAQRVPGWDVSDRDVSLAQMSLAHGCDEPDAACLAQIARTLSTDRILYGSVRRTSAGEDFNYAVTIYLFNSHTDQIEGSVTDSVPRVQSDVDDLRPRVERYVADLSGAVRLGTLRVSVNVTGAPVLVDGRQSGRTDDDGELTLEVPSGRRRVEVRAPGHQTFHGTVTVVSGETAELSAELQSDSGRPGGRGPDTQRVVAYASLGAAAVFAALTIVAWQNIDCIASPDGAVFDICADDPQFERYQGAAGQHFRSLGRDPTQVDVCVEAGRGSNFGTVEPSLVRHVQELCDAADVWEPLQYLFAGLTLASGGLGTYLLLTADDDESDASDDTQLSVRPSFGATGGGLSATLQF